MGVYSNIYRIIGLIWWPSFYRKTQSFDYGMKTVFLFLFSYVETPPLAIEVAFFINRPTYFEYKPFIGKGEQKMDKFFKLSENNTSISQEFVAGLTTFFAMVYIIFVNPMHLSTTGMPWGAVFLATIFATVIGTLLMGLFANVPYAQAPGMGLNTFFAYTVVGGVGYGFGFSWQEALALVFICGIINMIITVSKVRRQLIIAIPKNLQSAISGGIGLFIAYIGLVNVQIISFPNGIPTLADFSDPSAILAIIGVILTLVLILLKVKGAILIGIVAATVLGIPMGVTNLSGIEFNVFQPFSELPITFGAAFGGLGSLFSDVSKLPLALLALFAFSLTDTFDTIGTFVGTSKKSKIFTDEELYQMGTGKGFKTRVEKALFADMVATTVGAVLGTSNVTTYVESAAGIEEGGRTGLTAVFVSALFLLTIFISPLVGIVPAAATAPALIIVGILMASSFGDVNWRSLEDAIPAFFTIVVMALAYNISYGIAFGFISYVIVKVTLRKTKDIHPILLASGIIFLVYFIFKALNGAGIF